MATKPAKVVPHSASITLVGEIVEPAAVITPMATEWPKVGCRVLVKHNPDQATVFNVVSIGPVAEAMLRMKPGRTVKVVGQIKAATGALEVFATSFEKPGSSGIVMVSPFASLFGGGSPKEPWERPQTDEDDDTPDND